MAEFLVRVHDKINPDSVYADMQCLKRGDVVVVCRDGWEWSGFELTAPDWRIVKIPGFPLDEAETFLAQEPGDRETNRMLRRRAFRADVGLASLPAGIKAWLADDSRAQPTITITATQIRNLKTLKVPLDNPNVIG